MMTAQSNAEINGRKIMNVPIASTPNNARPSSRSTGSASSRKPGLIGGSSIWHRTCAVDAAFHHLARRTHAIARR